MEFTSQRLIILYEPDRISKSKSIIPDFGVDPGKVFFAPVNNGQSDDFRNGVAVVITVLIISISLVTGMLAS